MVLRERLAHALRREVLGVEEVRTPGSYSWLSRILCCFVTTGGPLQQPHLLALTPVGLVGLPAALGPYRMGMSVSLVRGIVLAPQRRAAPAEQVAAQLATPCP